MDDRSESFFPFVHPDLVKVLRAASQSPQPFIVVYGIRTPEAEMQAYISGHSRTLHSRHLPSKTEKLSCAVDVAAIIDGRVSFAPGKEQEVFGQIFAQIKAASEDLRIPVEWGGDWRTLLDYSHIQLPWCNYP